MDTLIFLAAGALGAALRALAANDQDTFSRKSIVDVVVGALAGVLYPVFPVMALPTDASVWQQAALVALVGYVGASIAQNTIGRIQGEKASP